MTNNNESAPEYIEHAVGAANAYRELRPLYEGYAEKIRNLLLDSIHPDWQIHSINSRTKSVESFQKKAMKAHRDSDTESWKPKYPKPLEQITDLAGIRVITFFPKDTIEIMSLIEREFQLVEKRDVGEERFSEGRFGYQSIHYLVRLGEQRESLSEYKKYTKLVSEIQVRTILQHAWAEMEHDIKYKSAHQIPRAIERRFIALAGMIEIADREFQAIQDEDSRLKTSVRASLQDDLTLTTLATAVDSTDPSDTSSQREGTIEVSAALDSQTGWTANNARDLISNGKYDDAIALYSRMIASEPTSFTLYIGRAKARFLAGDMQGALIDLDNASTGRPADENIRRLRVQMEEGYLPVNPTANAWQLSTTGNEKLALGEGEEAFRLYSRAQVQGFNYTFSTFNKAMALALVKDSNGAQYCIEQITVSHGTPTEINILALRAIVAAISKSSFTSSIASLKSKLANHPAFDFKQSPLRHLESGFVARDIDINPKIASVFRSLKFEA